MGREDPNITQNGPSSARQRNAIEMAFRWRTDDGPTLTAGLVFDGIRTSISRKPCICVIFFLGGHPDPLSPSGSTHALEF